MDGDALFFRQLLLPMCDPKKSGINEPEIAILQHCGELEL
jgi:hypothetical protein